MKPEHAQRDHVLPVDDETVEVVLAQLCPTTRVHAVRSGPRSYSNRLWLAETDEGTLLIRLPGRDTDPEYVRAGLVAARSAAEAGVPAPRVRAFAPDSPAGVPVVVQEYRPGRNATDVLGDDPGAVTGLAHTLGDWVGRLHGVTGPGFGSVLSPDVDVSWGEVVCGRVQNALRVVGTGALPETTSRIERRFVSLIDDCTTAIHPGLVHGDLYFDNVLTHHGSAVALLDFEHAWYADRLADFGKLGELLFEWWPASREPFMAAYRNHVQPDEDDDVRRELAVGLYELSQLAYFHRWQADLVPVYRDRLQGWLASG